MIQKQSREHSWSILGIDPAPSKSTSVYGHWQSAPPSLASVKAHELKHLLESWKKTVELGLIAWDAPLSFDAEQGFFDRAIDKTVRRVVQRLIREKYVEPGAVSALPFAQCPHWAMTCFALGHPFQGTSSLVSLALSLDDIASINRGHYAIEVHPAVTLLAWFCEYDLFPLRRYKPGAKQSRMTTQRNLKDIIQKLHDQGVIVPDACQTEDDPFDAWIGYTMANDFIGGHAVWVGSSAMGGYVLPKGKLVDELQAALEGNHER